MEHLVASRGTPVSRGTQVEKPCRSTLLLRNIVLTRACSWDAALPRIDLPSLISCAEAEAEDAAASPGGGSGGVGGYQGRNAPVDTERLLAANLQSIRCK